MPRKKKDYAYGAANRARVETEKKPARKKRAPKIDFRKAAIELASCVILTLKLYKHLKNQGTTFAFDKNGRPDFGTSRRWQDKFMDALDLVGYEIDRPAYYAAQVKKRVRR